jgi:hypothetical protein
MSRYIVKIMYLEKLKAAYNLEQREYKLKCICKYVHSGFHLQKEDESMGCGYMVQPVNTSQSHEESYISQFG